RPPRTPRRSSITASRTFSFPTKESGGVVLPAGRYEALRVIIGSGRGNNWWCILFPPFCLGELGGGVEKLPVAGPDAAPGAEVSSGWVRQAQTGSPVSIPEWDGTVPPDAVAAPSEVAVPDEAAVLESSGRLPWRGFRIWLAGEDQPVPVEVRFKLRDVVSRIYLAYFSPVKPEARGEAETRREPAR
ncbi:MAG: stage II sporulation protein R, partial [Firmicutes bacterium]|nr:stage II sporulation protein R [Bacillota bacterium]